jgi:hypothetical protein
VAKTKIFFHGYQAPPYPGASAKGAPSPTHESAVSWGAGVGGTYANFKTTGDFALHFKGFLDMAYAAGVRDAKEELREKLGL